MSFSPTFDVVALVVTQVRGMCCGRASTNDSQTSITLAGVALTVLQPHLPELAHENICTVITDAGVLSSCIAAIQTEALVSAVVTLAMQQVYVPSAANVHVACLWAWSITLDGIKFL